MLPFRGELFLKVQTFFFRRLLFNIEPSIQHGKNKNKMEKSEKFQNLERHWKRRITCCFLLDSWEFCFKLSTFNIGLVSFSFNSCRIQSNLTDNNQKSPSTIICWGIIPDCKNLELKVSILYSLILTIQTYWKWKVKPTLILLIK